MEVPAPSMEGAMMLGGESKSRVCFLDGAPRVQRDSPNSVEALLRGLEVKWVQGSSSGVYWVGPNR